MKPRVLFTDTYPAHFAGAQRTLADLATRLSDRFEVSAATVAEGPASEAWRDRGLDVHIVPYPKAIVDNQGRLGAGGLHRAAWQSMAFVRHALSCARLVRRERIDVVYCSNVRSVMSFGVGARLMRRPVVLYVQQLEQSSGLTGRAAVRVSRRVLSLSARVDRAFPHGIPRERFRVVPLGIETVAWPARSHEDLTSPPVIACVCRVTPGKGLDVVIAALAEHVSRHRVVLRVVGSHDRVDDAKYVDALRQQAAAAGVQVEWTGEVDDVRQALSGATALVSGSRREGLPRSMMEAMALGLPVVTTDVGAVRDLVVDGVTGFVVAPDDPAALGAALNRLLDDPGLAERCGSAGRTRVLEHFDLSDTVDAFAAEFEALSP